MRQQLIRILIILAAAGALVLFRYFKQPEHAADKSQDHSASISPQTAQGNTTSASSAQLRELDKIRAAQHNPDAKFWVTVQGTVAKLLKDDMEGVPHQRFLVKITPDITLLVAHNSDLAQRVPVQVGDLVTLKGEYVWNHKGGVLHWTHHDPQGRKGGWIELAGQRYQ
jgi:hypothetical protein